MLVLKEYRESHLPGAVHIHLRRLAEQARDRLDPARPVVVYCYGRGWRRVLSKLLDDAS